MAHIEINRNVKRSAIQVLINGVDMSISEDVA